MWLWFIVSLKICLLKSGQPFIRLFRLANIYKKQPEILVKRTIFSFLHISQSLNRNSYLLFFFILPLLNITFCFQYKIINHIIENTDKIKINKKHSNSSPGVPTANICIYFYKSGIILFSNLLFIHLIKMGLFDLFK